jgi:hypothetical protein
MTLPQCGDTTRQLTSAVNLITSAISMRKLENGRAGFPEAPAINSDIPEPVMLIT